MIGNMNKFEEFVNLCDEINDKVCGLLRSYESTLVQKDKEFIQCIHNDIDQFHRTGILSPSLENRAEVHAETPAEVPVELPVELSAVETPSTKPRGRRTKQQTIPPVRTPSNSDSSSKENEPENNTVQRSTTTRAHRSAFKDSTQADNQSQNVVKPPEPLQELSIKVERITDEYRDKVSELGGPNAMVVELKKEFADMPPPTKPAPRNARKTRGKQSKKVSGVNVNPESVQVKAELISEERKKKTNLPTILDSLQPEVYHCRDSDVQIQTVVIDTVTLNDSVEEPERPSKTRARTKNKRKLDSKQKGATDDESEAESKKQRRREEEPTPVPEMTRATRTKTRARAKVEEEEKQLQSESSAEDEKKKVTATKTQPKRGKDKEPLENNTVKNESMALDAGNTTITTGKNTRSKRVLNETMVIDKPAAALNETVTLEKPVTTMLNVTTTLNVTATISTASNCKVQPSEQDLMTDDEDVVDSSQVTKKLRKGKPVFSPYEERPVKNRVQAFEKLCAEATTEIPTKIPSSITRNMAKMFEKTTVNGDSAENHKVLVHPYMSPVRDQLSSSKAQNRNLSSSTVSNSTLLSDLKASRSETRVRQLRQKQKETEISRKQEAILQAMTEERKRRREERQLRAQQARDAMEKEKQKALDSAARAKEEKLKKVLSEKEEKLQKQREQLAQKRAQAIKKAAEEKIREEKKKEEQKINEKKAGGKVIPPYLKYETPLLPTADCYDSDDEKSRKPHYIRSWEKKANLLMVLQHMRFVEAKRRHLFRPQIPNLVDIFPAIESYKLKRTSSAIWDRSATNSRLETLSEED